MQSAKKIIVNCQGLMDLAKKTNNKLNYELISNGVDTKFFTNIPEKEKYKKFTVTAGATILGKKKGLSYLIKAFAEFASDKQDVELLLIGDGDLKESLETMTKDLKLNEKVKFVGRKNKDWLKINLPKCHVFCLPSLNEGMSNATLEAMACGLPIIVTDVGGKSELLKENGFLVPKRNSKEITRRLETLYADESLRKEMAEESSKIVREMSWEKVAKKYLKEYGL
ncbi:MAG: glycosyltransferase [Patescibacteria group bacterium]|nr:glycosyltransferase [Patescibacteria group bacterium]